MIMFIIQLAFLIISTVYVYKTAKSNGHNVLLWTSMNLVAFLVAPLVIGMSLGIIAAIGVSMQILDFGTMETAISIAGWVLLLLSVGCVLWILRHVSSINEAGDFEPPPSPGVFDLDS